ncbi:MAG: MT-A70 family methyltransferase [Pseudomonadota bacterium]
MTWPFGDLGMFRYGCILADPPWQYELRSEKGEAKSPQAQYHCVSLGDIKALPVAHLAAPDCLLLMWATFPMLPQALKTMAAWGFTYKSGASWAKQSSTGQAWSFGTGYIFRSASELLLAGTIGTPKYRSRSVRNLIVAPVRGHSRKPDDQYDMAASLSDGPYCELFARQTRPGWDVWGNETDKFEAAA